MNRRQWGILVAGGVLALLVVVIRTVRPHPPIALPMVEVSPGLYRYTFIDAVVPPSAVLAFIAISVLTGVIAFSCRTRSAP